MKIPLRIIFVCVLAATTFIACQDQLTKAPLDAPSNVTFFSNQTELELAVNAIYTGLWWHENSSPAPATIDNATDLGFLRFGGLQGVGRGEGSATTGVFHNAWTNFYNSIGKANNLLDNMDRAQDLVDEVVLRRIEAEARFLRAFYYHYLIELFGDVPLLTSVPLVEEAQLPRTPKSEVVDQIISDLDFASQNLPISWSGSNEGRATRGAALTLKARVALYNERFDTAIDAAQNVMNSGEYSLYPDYENMFTYDGIRNEEVIFDVPYQRGVRTHEMPVYLGSSIPFGWGTIVPSQFLVDSYQATDGKPIDQSDIYDPSKPFENRDPRLHASIILPQSEWGGIIFESHPDSLETWQVDGEEPFRITNWDSQSNFNLATFTGYLWRKYADPIDFPDHIQDSELNFILMRFAEVLLIYAEAKIESNSIDQSVLDALNRVRARGYGVEPSQTDLYPAITTTSQSELRNEVRYERKVELALEGFRLFDIRRWGIADQVMSGPLVGRPLDDYSTMQVTPAINLSTNYHPDYGGIGNLYRTAETRVFSQKDWLWAIPQAEINANENITQNPGY